MNQFTLTASVIGLALVATPQVTRAVTVTFEGTDFEVETITGTFDDLESTLISQVWWGNSETAGFFASEVGNQLGLNNGFGPNFSFDVGSQVPNRVVSSQVFSQPPIPVIPPSVGVGSSFSNDEGIFAIAAGGSASVPEPSTIFGTLAAIGFGSIMMRNQMRKNAK